VTFGYEGRSAAEVVDLARDAAVLVDVRYNALSHKPGLSKSRLGAALAEAGVEYLHLRALGNPRDNRDAFRAGDPGAYDVLRARLRTGEGADAVALVAERARHETVALLCVEREPERCHRSLVAEAVVERDPRVAAENR
jgi:uncharacterized protein (DUF488 family)